MTGFAEYEQYDGLGLAELVRQGQVTPDELLDAAIERVEARNGAVNAVVSKLYDRARQSIASGLPVGGDLEYADEVTLGRAFEGRRLVGG